MDESNKAIADLIPLPACIYGARQQSILYANQLFHALTAHQNLRHASGWPGDFTTQLQQLLPHQNTSFTINFKEPDGRDIPVLVNAGPLDQSADCVLITFTVLPAGKLTGASAKTGNDLIKLAAEFDDFVYAASHDLQEPLRKITTFSGRLAATLGNNIPQEPALYLDRLQAAADNMRGLINSLLQLSRVNTSKEAYKMVNLQTVAMQVLKTLEAAIQQKKVRVTLNKLPVIEASATQMEELLFHLLSNAVKFSRNNITPEISIGSNELTRQEKEENRLAAQKSYYKILITDNGIGFEQQYAETIFKTFTRLNGKSEYEGFGIGLAVCKKIIEKHNGIITAKSRPAENESAENIVSTFILILPANQSS